MKVKHRAFSCLTGLILVLAAAPALCGAQAPASAAAVVDKLRALKPANVELQSVVVKDAQGHALQGAADAQGGTVEVSGYAAGSAGVAGYLGSITNAGMGEVNLREIRPENSGAQRRTHFVFLLALPARDAKAIANDFVSIDPSAEVWYSGARFFPQGKAVHGVPLQKIDRRWCAANEFKKELFPPALYGMELDGLDALAQNGGTFALTGKLEGIGQVTLLTGVFKTCAGKTGSFLLALKDATSAKPVVYLQENDEKAAFTFLMGDVHQFTLNDCIGCDPGPSYTWVGGASNSTLIPGRYIPNTRLIKSDADYQ